MSGRSKFDGFGHEISELEWSRMAAFLDGEGCILIHSTSAERRARYNPKCKSPHHALQLIMANTDPRLAVWCNERFGGYMYQQEASKRNSKHRDAFRWVATSRRAEAILRGCLPYFLLKREQADIALAFCSVAWTQLAGETLPQSVIDKRYELQRKLEAEKIKKFEVIEGFKKFA